MSRLLESLGWKPFFGQQLSLEDLEILHPARVMEIQRTGLVVCSANGEHQVNLGGRWFQEDAEARPTVGDWVLLGELRDTIERVLERSSLIKRLSAGTTSDVQLIAANVDTLFIVSSCNEDFNLSRIERYLALALDAGVRPVIVLTKVDLVDDHQGLIEQVHTLRSDLVVEGVVATRADTLGNLLPWCASGQTVALLGSSGVGKSTLVNSLSGEEVQTTAGVREDDGRGRHTTTHRSLHPLARGGLLLDSPGMRELGIVDAQAGVGQLFEDIDDLSRRCRFSDCAHAQEPGCAVRAAIESSELDERRFESYQKLLREEMYNTETIAERHTRSRQFGKMVRQHLAHSHKKR